MPVVDPTPKVTEAPTGRIRREIWDGDGDGLVVWAVVRVVSVAVERVHVSLGFGR